MNAGLDVSSECAVVPQADVHGSVDLLVFENDADQVAFGIASNAEFSDVVGFLLLYLAK